MEHIEMVLDDMPILAILRHVRVQDAVSVAGEIFRAGIGVVEVPLNSKNALESIQAIAKAYPDFVCGAGTVSCVGDVGRVKKAGGEVIVSPCVDEDVIRESLAQHMLVLPGCLTPTEAFCAVRWGARYLKLFPASSVGRAHIQAVKSVLPKGVKIFAVGGVGADNLDMWHKAGADGYGIGGELYKPNMSLRDVYARSSAIVSAYKAIHIA